MKLLKHCLFYVLLLYGTLVQAQCINTFPYTEDFEANNGNWVSGGTGNDWAWGQVSKSYIQQAASGNNCWVIGGLSNSFYNFNERSYLQSPCFNFTNLQAPYISFSIFWDTENIYDGGNLQYSTDAITWINIGSYNEQPDCILQNWYNTSNINNLTNLAGVKEGWSGNTQNTQGSCQGGNGSNGWKTAKHCLSNLIGLPQVYFRFTFGAGTTCNSYDGIAIDNITIGSAPNAIPGFTYTCNGNLAVFTAITAKCATNPVWMFADGSTAAGLNATHALTPGVVENVTIMVNGACGATYSSTRPVEVLKVTTTTLPVSCYGYSNGMAIAQTQGLGPFSYEWSTDPPQYTDTALGLSAGTYTVNVSTIDACGSAVAVVTEPPAFTVDLTALPDTCALALGTINSTVNGGNLPYQYLWSNNATTANLDNLQQGSYQLTVTDASACSVTEQAEVGYTSGLTFQVVERKDVTCFGSNDGKASIQVSGGTGPYSYVWSNNANTATIQKLPEGVYTLTVSDSQGCTDSTKIEIDKVQCESYVDFPTAFSPNGDGVNDVFRARYSPDVKKFNMRIYNRWGELVFAGDDILEGWNGTYKNVAQPMGTFVWLAEYSFSDGSSNTSSGNVTLLR